MERSTCQANNILYEYTFFYHTIQGKNVHILSTYLDKLLSTYLLKSFNNAILFVIQYSMALYQSKMNKDAQEQKVLPLFHLIIDNETIITWLTIYYGTFTLSSFKCLSVVSMFRYFCGYRLCNFFCRQLNEQIFDRMKKVLLYFYWYRSFYFAAKLFNGLYTINTLHLCYLSKLEFGNRNIKKSGEILRTMKCFIFCKNAKINVLIDINV